MDLRTMGYGFAAATLGQAAILELSRTGPASYEMLAACRDSYNKEIDPILVEIADFLQMPLEERLNYKIQGVDLSKFAWWLYDAAKKEFGEDLYFSVMPKKHIHDFFIMKKCQEFLDSDEKYASALSLTSTIAGGLILTTLIFPNIFSTAVEGVKLTQSGLRRVYSKCVSSRQVFVRKVQYVKKLSDSIFRRYMVKVTAAVKVRSNRLKKVYMGLQDYTEYTNRLLNNGTMPVKMPSNPKVVRSLIVRFKVPQESLLDSVNGQTTLSTPTT